MRPKKSISYQELRDLIPEQYLDDLAIKTKVDHSVSKLTGQNMFSLLLYGFTSGRLVSLRILEQIFNSPIFFKGIKIFYSARDTDLLLEYAIS